MAWAVIYFHTKWHLDPSSRYRLANMGQKLATTDMVELLSQTALFEMFLVITRSYCDAADVVLLTTQLPADDVDNSAL